MAENKERGEVEIPLGESRFRVRPTLDLIARIEARHGSIIALARSMEGGNYRVSDVIQVAALALEGVEGAGDPADLAERLFEVGAPTLVGPVYGLLVGGIAPPGFAEPAGDGEKNGRGAAKKRR